MSDVVTAKAAGERWGAPEQEGARALVTSLGIIEGEVLLFLDRKSTRLNSSHPRASRMPSSA